MPIKKGIQISKIKKGTERVLQVSYTRYIKNVIELGQLQQLPGNRRSKMSIKKRTFFIKNLKNS